MSTDRKVQDFVRPTGAPEDASQHARWHQANRAWWEFHPMRYDWKSSLALPEGTAAWYQEIDRRFFSATTVPARRQPFDSLIPFPALRDMQVLEVGVGMGSHAQLLAGAARSFLGVDLTSAAVTATHRRLRLFGLPGSVLQMNAEQLAFPDNYFDLVWSWGVIHHAADTRAVLHEIHRVLKPTGRAMIMVYHRALVPWYAYDGFLRSLLLGKLWRYRTIHGVVQSVTDGALARFYTPREWRREVDGLFRVEHLAVHGDRAEAVPLPAGPWKDRILRVTPVAALRFWLSTLRQGRLLFTRLVPLKS